MRQASLMAAVLAVYSAAGAAAQSLEVGSARFYRGAGNQTVVDGFVRVPFTLLSSVSRSTNAAARYRVALTVRDSANLELVVDSWTRSIPARLLGTPRGSSLEHFTFAASPGRYTIEVAVHDSASGRVARTQTPLTAFAGRPAASDVLLVTGMRLATGADTARRAGELRKGGVILEPAVRPLLTPTQASLGYYLEWYRQGFGAGAAAETTAVSVRVLKPDGTALVTTPAQQVPFEASGGATRGMLDLAGLPPGDYGLEVVVAGRDTTVARQAPFRMGGFESVALTEPPPAADAFETMSEAQLDTVYAPLIYLMTSDETGIYPSLTVEGKRSYLRRFWAKRDPTAGTARNEEQEAFYARIAEANRRYREGGAAEIPGWRTDRGRIFIKNGPPTEILRRPQAGNTLPYEAWKYSRDRALKYVFMDLTQFGNYALIWTDDRREPSRPNWASLLGPEGVEDVARF
ncbi:MAG TPA: GWxTD domain-containing protein [Gemmatimonadales bacterium]|nr:GWxTD domain-containing protein [Gemmatimonadales bacterium]